MKITVDLLKRYNADDSIIEFVSEKYPQGAEIIEVMEDSISKFGLDFLHFIKKYFPLNKGELIKYNELCDVEESMMNIWYSDHIYYSDNVARSSNVKDSSFIFESQNVFMGKDVYNSMNINSSANIFHSNNVKDSTKIIESHDVSDSISILRSSMIKWSSIIMNSFLIDGSEYIYKSENLNDCYFCGFCKNCKHCLFCSGLDGADYMIFNQKVSISEFELWREKLLIALEFESSKFIKIDASKHTVDERFEVSKRFDSIFEGLSSNFYGWTNSVLNYNEDIFLAIFFRDR